MRLKEKLTQGKIEEFIQLSENESILQKEKERNGEEMFKNFVAQFEYVCVKFEVQKWILVELNDMGTSKSIENEISKLKSKIQNGKENTKQIFRKEMKIVLKKLIHCNDLNAKNLTHSNEEEYLKRRIGKMNKWMDWGDDSNWKLVSFKQSRLEIG
jgi:hypothetical protein